MDVGYGIGFGWSERCVFLFLDDDDDDDDGLHILLRGSLCALLGLDVLFAAYFCE